MLVGLGRVALLVLAAAAPLTFAELRYHHLPAPTPASAGAFDPARAHALLARLLADDAPRPVGSAASVAARRMIAAELVAMGYEAREEEAFVCSELLVCGRVVNVVAELPGRSRDAVVFAAHFDSVAASPGALDDALGVVVGLELARVLAARPERTRSIIFLFDDGEEPGLLGAQAFLEDAARRARLRAFVNVDGMSGLTALSLGPGDGALLDAAAAAPRPLSSSMEGIFQRGSSGFNDARLFRDAGIPSLVLAGRSGYERYHNRLDCLADVDPAVLAERGDTALQVLSALLDGELAAEAEPPPVFFDLLGLTLVRLSSPALLGAMLLGALLVAASWRRLALRVTWEGAATLSLGALAVLLGDLLFATLFGAPSGAELMPLESGQLARLLFDLALLALMSLTLPMPRVTASLGTLVVAQLIAATLALGLSPPLAPLVLGPLLAGLLAAVLCLQREVAVWVGLGAAVAAASVLCAPLSLFAPTGAHGVGAVLEALPRLGWMAPLAAGLAAAPRRPRLVLALVTLALALGVLRASMPTSPRPVASSVRLHADADAGTARWLIFGAAPPGVAGLTAEARLFPWSSGASPGFVLQGAPTLGSPPTVTVLEDAEVAEGRRLRLRLASWRGAHELQLAVAPGPRLTALKLRGRAVPLEIPLEWSHGWRLVTVVGLGGADVTIDAELTFETSGPIELRVADLQRGLSPSIAALAPPRPAHFLPTHLGDATMVSARVTLGALAPTTVTSTAPEPR